MSKSWYRLHEKLPVNQIIDTYFELKWDEKTSEQYEHCPDICIVKVINKPNEITSLFFVNSSLVLKVISANKRPDHSWPDYFQVLSDKFANILWRHVTDNELMAYL